MEQLTRLRTELDELLASLPQAEKLWTTHLAAVAPTHRDSARNLVHYWAIRQFDLRRTQEQLAAHGLSSLGRGEAHVEAMLWAVRAALCALDGGEWRVPGTSAIPIGRGVGVLRRRTVELLGPTPAGRRTRIMVTLPSEAADDKDLVVRLVDRGMNIARVNCAHDDATAWRAMADHVRSASASAGRECRILMDLAGPKLRTGPLEPGPALVRLRPRRDTLGRVTAPALAWLTSVEDPVAAPDPDMVMLPVPRQWLDRRQDGETLRVRDTRGASRRLSLSTVDNRFVARADRTTYLTTGSVLRPAGTHDTAVIGPLPPVDQSLRLRPGDVVDLTRDCAPAVVTAGSPRIGCTLPEVFDHAHVGDRVFFDDGRIGGTVAATGPAVLRVRIDRAAPGGSRLRGGKGVNLPDTRLPVPAMTDKDMADLPTVLELADMVALSFVRAPADVLRLLDELDRLGDQDIGVVLKIETRQAFQQLPQLLLTAMRRRRVGVMLARGDLAVECGYERLAELQEEILWLCESAHLPVIWATQVLEQLAKRGQPSRAEISDAAMSERAECVMLNKGPFIEDAVSVLDDVLHRMTSHHYKKNALLRCLRSWHPDNGDEHREMCHDH